MREYASRMHISVEELRMDLDATMKAVSGPTFEEGVEKVCYVIKQPPPKKSLPRSRDLLKVDTDFLKRDEVIPLIDQAVKDSKLPWEALAIAEVAVKSDKPPSLKSHKKKGEGWDPMFGLYHDARLD